MALLEHDSGGFQRGTATVNRYNTTHTASANTHKCADKSAIEASLRSL